MLITTKYFNQDNIKIELKIKNIDANKIQELFLRYDEVLQAFFSQDRIHPL